MTRSSPLRLLLRVCVMAVLLLAGIPARAAAPAMAEWRVVLVAGDNGEPAFDNAVDAVARWLVERGVPPRDIHRLSASPLARNPSIEPASVRRVLQGIVDLGARPGERCLVFITSHGRRDSGVWLAYRGEFLSPADLAQALALGCANVPTVAIVSSCYSGAFSGGPMRAPNRIILTAARADRPSFGCGVGRTYTVFDQCLLATLPRERTWRATYRRNSACVRRNEKRLGDPPSLPQAFFGAAVRNLAVR